MDILDQFVHRDFIEQELGFSEVYKYLDLYLDFDWEPVQKTDIKRNKSVKLNRTIWIFWKQGMENAPLLVQKCYESVCRNKPQDFEIILLTDSNLNKYIDLPDYIQDKFEKGYMEIAHLSDVIRLELLHTYGGCWIDATVFCSGKIPEYMLKGDMFVFKLASVLTDPVLKLSNWWISADQTNRLIDLTRQALYKYWQSEVSVRNYFLFHIIMSKLIDENWECKDIFQRIPYFNSGHAHVLQGKLGAEYREEEWQTIKSTACVHKLTYKIRYLQGDIYNYYMALLANDL
ncbi:MAG: capsular biosynthesis protein [Lachnospiraceae bacterium]|nr:capsular biosynthesis protein [Lachnospiraceae bacterium]